MTNRSTLFKLLSLLVCSALAASIGNRHTVEAADKAGLSSSSQPKITLVEEGLTFSWESPQLKISKDQTGFNALRMQGFTNLRTPGLPMLPVASFLVAIPPEARPELIVTSLNERYQVLDGAIEVAPQPQGVLFDERGDPKGAAVAPADALGFAPEPLVWEYLGVTRGLKLARVSFYPVIPLSGKLRIIEGIEARFMYPDGKSAPAEDDQRTKELSLNEDTILQSLAGHVVNRSQMQPAERTSIASAYPADLLSPLATSSQLIIEIESSGITALSYEGLAAAGFPVSSVNPHHLHLYQAENEAAAEWEGDADTVFEPGERLLFFADPPPNRWARFGTYLLTEENTPGIRMTTRDANPTGAIVGNAFVDYLAEQNLYYSPQCYCGSTPAGWDGDRWVWQGLSLPDQTLGRFNAALTNVNTSRIGKLTVHLVSYTDVIQNPDHRVQFFFNANALGELQWNGKQAIQATFDLPVGTLLNGINELALELPGIEGISKEGVWLDAFVVRYALGTGGVGDSLLFFGEAVPRAYQLSLSSSVGLRAYQVTENRNPIRLTNLHSSGSAISLKDPEVIGPQRYIVLDAAGIRNPTRMRVRQSLPGIGQGGFNGADYLVITTAEFAPALNDLIAFREGQGLTSHIQTVQAIYDQYADGIPHPEAIRLYLKDAYETWPIRPTYVLLVGDGNYDPKGYLANSWNSHIPPYLAMVDPWAGETAADNRFVAIDGDDSLPDMLVGRFPVNSLAQTQALVNKTLLYENTPQVGAWSKDVVFIADNPDEAGNFTEKAEYLATNDVPAPFTAHRFFYTPPTNTATQIHSQILSQMNAGSNIIVYIGHSSPSQWAVENLFHMNEIAGLNNAGRLPVLLESTCFTGFFQMPGRYSMDETFILNETGGAAAVWGPSGLGLLDGHWVLMDGFLKEVYINQRRGIGQAALQAKLNLAATIPAYMNLVETYTLFGDPAMDLGLPLDYQDIFLPIILR